MSSTSKLIPALGDDPFVITGRAIARHALGEIIFDDPRSTRSFLPRGATPLLIRSERGFAFHLVSSGQPMACLLPWDTPVARDPIFVGPEPDAGVTERQAWERVWRSVAHARAHAMWLTAEEALDSIDRMETADGTCLTRRFARDPGVLRLQLRLALHNAAGMVISAEDIAKLLAEGDDTVHTWVMRRVPRLTASSTPTG